MIPLSEEATLSTFNGSVIRLKKASSSISSILLNVPLKLNKPVLSQPLFNIAAVMLMLSSLLLHAMIFFGLLDREPYIKEEKQAAAPMMVSIVAPPTKMIPVDSEVLPIDAPVKKIKKAKPNKTKSKPKKVIQKEVAMPVQPIVEEVAAPVTQEVEDLAQQDVAPAPLAAVELAPEPEIVEEQIEPPKFGVSYLNNPAPSYPRISRKAGQEGRVLLKVLVSAKGDAKTVNIEQSSGYQRLDNAALKAVMRWRFVPARKGAETLSAYVLVPINFTLNH